MATVIVRQSFGLDAIDMSLFFVALLPFVTRQGMSIAERSYSRIPRPVGTRHAAFPCARPLFRFQTEANSTFPLPPSRYEPLPLVSRLPLPSLCASIAGGLVAYLVHQIRYSFYSKRRRSLRVLRNLGVAAATLALLASSPAAADVCKGNIFNEAAALYHIDPDLLRAITWVESRGVPSAVGPRLPDGHRAWGAAQINDVHLPELVSYGVTQRDLLNPCVNLKLSAWVLANCIQAKGATWAAVGCYNTGPGSTNAAAQARYVRLVQRAYAGYRAQSTLGNSTERGSQ